MQHNPFFYWVLRLPRYTKHNRHPCRQFISSAAWNDSSLALCRPWRPSTFVDVSCGRNWMMTSWMRTVGGGSLKMMGQVFAGGFWGRPSPQAVGIRNEVILGGCDSLLTCTLQTTLKCCRPDWWTAVQYILFHPFSFSLHINVYTYKNPNIIDTYRERERFFTATVRS